jgi:hypothetical protein
LTTVLPLPIQSLTVLLKRSWESFQLKLDAPESKAKAEIWMPKAKEAVRLTKEVSDYIEQLKLKIKVEAGFDPKDPESKFKEDNVDIATRIMDKQGEGEKLRKKLEEYRTKMLAIDPTIGKMFEKNLPINTRNTEIDNRSNGESNLGFCIFPHDAYCCRINNAEQIPERR